MNIALCEDEQEQQNTLKKLISEWMIQTKVAVNVAFFTSGEQFLASWDSGVNYDIVFLDIGLEGMDGMKAARKIRERDDMLTLVFLTSRIEYVLKGYEVNAWRYLLKPVHASEFFQCLNKAKEMSDRNQEVMIIHNDNRYYKIAYDSIQYLEAFGHYVEIHTTNGTYQMRAGISQMEAKLPKHFFRCHRSYIVNVNEIKEIKDQQVKVGDDWISLSVKKRGELQLHLPSTLW
ncbi:LytR/AlgR family response regulator transcription factor [Anaerosporobacter faecicola]|uniref:LytR/AlgR family response regulator transcription factor n=1 Tax=Anaerosporobacter faecicola TaxID=2718714 RepID=UPI001438DC75|nr:LytTR family DNA-binding domain-containing protein [Anaerosporobacter faecicola]